MLVESKLQIRLKSRRDAIKVNIKINNLKIKTMNTIIAKTTPVTIARAEYIEVEPNVILLMPAKAGQSYLSPAGR
jgi:hypothetical protein